MSRSGEMAGRPAERTTFGWAALAAALAMTASTSAMPSDSSVTETLNTAVVLKEPK